MVLLVFCLQIQSLDVVLDVAVEHGLPELHVGPHHVVLYAAVGELSDARSQFLSENKDVLLLEITATLNS